MSKAYFELEMPKCCLECDLCVTHDEGCFDYCAGMSKAKQCSLYGRREDCPLRIMPDCEKLTAEVERLKKIIVEAQTCLVNAYPKYCVFCSNIEDYGYWYYSKVHHPDCPYHAGMEALEGVNDNAI